MRLQPVQWRPRCVLVVDDDHDIRETVAELVREAGYEPRKAVNGKDALAQLQAMSSEPCLVLLDLMMPEMSGAELIAVMQKTHRLAPIPVVLVSGSAEQDHAARRLIRKPLSHDVLLQVLAEYCGEP